MKKIILVLSATLLLTKIYSQQSLLIEKTPEKSKDENEEYEKKFKTLHDSISIYTGNIETSRNTNTKTDTIRDYKRKKILEDSLKELRLEKFSPPRVAFFAAASGTGTNDGGTDLLSSITASGKVSAQFHFFDNRKIYCGISANLAGTNVGTPSEKDSVDFNSLMFPESGDFGFVISPGWTFKEFWHAKDSNSLHSFGIAGEVGYRNVAIDSPAIGFKVLNYNLGVKWSYQFRPDDETVIGILIMPYYNFFNIPDEDVRDFNEFVNDSLFANVNPHASIQSLGYKVSIQYNTFNFSFDMRRNLDTSAFDDKDPFKGTVINIGFSTALNLKSWKD